MKNLLTQRTQICRCKMHWIPKKLPPWAIPSLGLLLPQPGMEPMPLAVEAWSLNHWITREVPGIKILFLRKAQPTPAQPSPSSLCTYLPLGQKPHGLISQRSRPGHGTLGQPGHLWVSLRMLLFSHPVMFDSLQPHGLQHARPPGPSPSPKVCPSSCPLHQWCHPAIYALTPPSPSALNPSQHQGLFQWVGCSHQMTEILELQIQHLQG